MRHHRLKSTVTATMFVVATLTSSVAMAGPVVPGGNLINPIHPLPPGIPPGNLCVTNPSICNDIATPPSPPTPPAPTPTPPDPHHDHGWEGAAAGFVGGMIGAAIVNGMAQPRRTVVVQQPQAVPVSNQNAHIQYCLQKYRSYVVQTNLYTAYSGQKKPCISPYM
jgi:hypothetical protein